ncbi:MULTISPECIES: 50S ribosomal protein L30 [Nocardiopsis]|jgi:large subunit ribosomal protein L30|uniref:Large ribosomal subunit protein uL30 n=5 Tax=Nocardiopsidaceae TaxID=83676 RepID=D7B8L4_NOCDD|nr:MULTISPECIES: 50S ribosomal protein L30 [Nocardiopsaceae]MEE2042852.1 50S ribosomal protein L30 [Nocardiopsis tropica]PDP86113.1 50S ribosomal protein L30 [Glycomyces fuscus]ADH70522.1 ribosomal protein L30 [Nocardiopsis dassonvillei subsp. dassonvillei DSM 43111]APC33794.1 50S ribosomal protein L30 [Nocardiopsis dassonvillei]ASU56649.1 50S ribosomal protein L30 [Nocardiopsis dassonvillei]
MAKLKITQTRSKIGGKVKQHAALQSLGLGRIGKSTVREDRPEVRGQITIVAHLVSVEEVAE